MPKIVTFAKQKGGTGATTLSLCTYFCLNKYSKNIKTAIVDLDPQESLFNLSIKNDGLEVFTKYNKKQLQNFDIVVVDTPPRLTSSFDKVFEDSNLIILPTKLSYVDAVATVQMYKHLESKAQHKKAFIVLNCAAYNTSFNDEVLESFKANNIPFLETVIYNRLAYQKMFTETGNIFNQKNRKASNEVQELTTEIFTLLSKY